MSWHLHQAFKFHVLLFFLSEERGQLDSPQAGQGYYFSNLFYLL